MERKGANMPSNNDEINEKHQTSLADHIRDQTTMLLFGKLVADMQPAPNGDRFAQIAGIMRDQVCQRLPKPILLALPTPDGPAAECGWDPKEYLMWRVASSFASTALHVQSHPLHQLFASPAVAGARMSRTQSLTVISKSIRAVTHSTRILDPADTLQLYGVITAQTVSQVRATITGDPQNGVAQFGFSLDGNALSLMSSSWTVDQLATTVEGAATQNV
jgi:hypothetical protein